MNSVTPLCVGAEALFIDLLSAAVRVLCEAVGGLG